MMMIISTGCSPKIKGHCAECPGGLALDLPVRCADFIRLPEYTCVDMRLFLATSLIQHLEVRDVPFEQDVNT